MRHGYETDLGGDTLRQSQKRHVKRARGDKGFETLQCVLTSSPRSASLGPAAGRLPTRRCRRGASSAWPSRSPTAPTGRGCRRSGAGVTGGARQLVVRTDRSGLRFACMEPLQLRATSAPLMFGESARLAISYRGSGPSNGCGGTSSLDRDDAWTVHLTFARCGASGSLTASGPALAQSPGSTWVEPGHVGSPRGRRRGRDRRGRGGTIASHGRPGTDVRRVRPKYDYPSGPSRGGEGQLRRGRTPFHFVRSGSSDGLRA